MTAPGVCLAWALVDGERVHAETMRGVPHDQRPRAICPCCSDVVVWKAGDVVTPHVAHAPGSRCAATNPETAAHWNAKFHVAELFNNYDDDKGPDYPGFKITCRKCNTTSDFHWFIRQCELMPYSRVEVEVPIGTRRADVAFVHEETAFFNEANEQIEWEHVTEEMFDRVSSKVISRDVTAAIEIKHSHAVDARKAEEYKRLGVPWIEISAEDALAWNSLDHAIKPLRVCELTQEMFERECESEACEHRRTTEYLHRREAEKRAAITKLHKQNGDELPSLWVVVAASVTGTRGPTVIAASVVGSNAPVRTWFIGDSEWHAAIWIAISRAIDRLDNVVPGRKATIFSRYVTSRQQISALSCSVDSSARYEDKERIALRAAQAGHVLLHSLPDKRLEDAFERTKAAAQAAPHHLPSMNTERVS